MCPGHLISLTLRDDHPQCFCHLIALGPNIVPQTIQTYKEHLDTYIKASGQLDAPAVLPQHSMDGGL
jgi:hypothetical protein